jgi:hypothetical protein
MSTVSNSRERQFIDHFVERFVTVLESIQTRRTSSPHHEFQDAH